VATSQQFQGLIRIPFVPLQALGFTEDRAMRPKWSWAGGAIFMQIAIALAVTRVPFIWTPFGYVNKAVAATETATLVGSSYMFGYSGDAPIPFLLHDIRVSQDRSVKKMRLCGR